jgi:hypothetical protein
VVVVLLLVAAAAMEVAGLGAAVVALCDGHGPVALRALHSLLPPHCCLDLV